MRRKVLKSESSSADLRSLKALTGCKSSEHKSHARAVLCYAEGMSFRDAGKAAKLSAPTVRLWWLRFLKEGAVPFFTPRRHVGRPCRLGPELQDELKKEIQCGHLRSRKAVISYLKSKDVEYEEGSVRKLLRLLGVKFKDRATCNAQFPADFTLTKECQMQLAEEVKNVGFYYKSALTDQSGARHRLGLAKNRLTVIQWVLVERRSIQSAADKFNVAVASVQRWVSWVVCVKGDPAFIAVFQESRPLWRMRRLRGAGLWKLPIPTK